MTAAFQGMRRIPAPINEPIKSYAPGSPERAELKARLESMASERIDIPVIIGGKEIRTGKIEQAVMPFDHKHVLADWHAATAADVHAAIKASADARRDWSGWPLEDRAAVILRAAELLATTWRATINAATMLGQAKTVFQSEIDAACELIDFWRFNAHYAQQLHEEQPVSSPGMWNMLEYRNLEGFVYAVSPFNFTAIGGNLSSAPALMGNTVIWKPASSSMLSAYYVMKVMEEAGMPPGVINFVPGDARQITDILLDSPEMAGIHFTGSTGVFNAMWKKVGENVGKYKTYPRIVGETGGKDFIVAHPSADPDVLRVAMIRGAFEYQGQKCSAASRAYVAKSVWAKMKDQFLADVENLSMGDVTDLSHFMGAVIDERSFAKLKAAITRARRQKHLTVLAGGQTDDSVGYFVRPTVVQSTDPTDQIFSTEYFGPLLAVHVYDDDRFERVVAQMESIAPYALTGAIIAQDRRAIAWAQEALRFAAGNFYINDKPTGAVVGQQPFGGARASGTNDKAGSPANLMRWTSPRSIKETFVPPTDHRYPHMG